MADDTRSAGGSGRRMKEGMATGPRILGLWGYALGVHFLVSPVVALLSGVYPWQFGSSMWRFASYGLFMEAAMVPIIGVFLLCVTAAALDHRLALRILSIGVAVTALVAIGATAMFVLDAIQVRVTIRYEVRRKWDITSARTVATGGYYVLTLLVLAWGSFRASRRERTARRKATADSRLLVNARA